MKIQITLHLEKDIELAEASKIMTAISDDISHLYKKSYTQIDTNILNYEKHLSKKSTKERRMNK